MTDYQEHQPKDEGKETSGSQLVDKVDAADDAIDLLVREIGELSDVEITPQNAVYIGGLLLTRRLESTFLYKQMQGQGEVTDWNHMFDNILGEETGEYKQTLTTAQGGNFKGLRQFVEEEVERKVADILEDDLEKKTMQGQKMRLVAERIPETGDGSIIKVPNPAWMEPPIPLRIQLQQMKSGGEVR